MTRATLLCLALLAACADDSERRVALPCDVRTRACQDSIFALTAEAREQHGARPPPVRIITRAQLEAEFRAQLEQSMAEPEDEAGRKTRLTQQALVLLGVLPADQSYDEAYVAQSVQSIAAYYSSETKRITIISDAAEDQRSASFTLSHEYVHALQDQRDDLTALRRKFVRFSDDDEALTSLIEGEATWLSLVAYRGAVFKEQPEELDHAGRFARSLDNTLMDIENADAPLIDANELLPYPMGGEYLAELYLEQGDEAIAALFQAPPLSLAQWLAADTRAEDADQLPEPLDCALPAAPDGYERLQEDRLGFAGLLALRVAHGQSGADAYSGSSQWRADRIASYASSDDPPALALAWRIRLGSADAAQELADALNGADSVSANTADREVLVRAASDANLLAHWPDADACPALEKARHQDASSNLLHALRERLGLVR